MVCMSCLSYPYTIIAGNILGGRYIYTNDLLALEAATPFKVSLPSDCCLKFSTQSQRMGTNVIHTSRQTVCQLHCWGSE